MSTKGNLTREQAVAIVGAEAVEKVGRENCEPTGRVGYNGACQGDAFCEWAASVSATNADGDDVTLVAYYYTSNEQDEIMAANDGDGSYIDWEIAGYEVA